MLQAPLVAFPFVFGDVVTRVLARQDPVGLLINCTTMSELLDLCNYLH